MPKPKAKYKWSVSRSRYTYTKTGRAVPESRVRAGLQAAVDSSKEKIGKLTQRLVNGKINVSAWHEAMKAEIKAAHRAAAMLANGGKLDARAAGRLGAVLKAQYKFLGNFARQIENGDVTLGARTVARARLYAQAVMTTYQKAKLARAKAAGIEMYRLVLSPAEHCDECLADAALDFVPIGSLPEIGSRTCLINCKCSWEYQ